MCDELKDDIPIAQCKVQINHPPTKNCNSLQAFNDKSHVKVHGAGYLQLFLTDNKRYEDSAEYGGSDEPPLLLSIERIYYNRVIIADVDHEKKATALDGNDLIEAITLWQTHIFAREI